MDLTVEGKIFVNGFFENACLGIKDGKIKSVKKILKSDNHLNFKNKLVLPAGVDIHVHFRDPGYTYKEDITTGSLAALFGGVSCVFDMPNTKPQTVSVQTVEDKISSFNKKSYVDFGLYAGVTDNNIDSISHLAKKSNGFKAYLGSSTNSLLLSKNNLKRVMQEVSKTGKIILFHAEDEGLLKKNKGLEKGLVDHVKARPSECEESAIKSIFEVSKNIGVKAHICHLSSIEGVELIKNRPHNLSCGGTPHHSLLDFENIYGSPGFYKVNPPIRSSFDREALFNSLNKGVIDILESDHAPHTKEEKEGDFDDIPSGVPGVETLYPLFLYLAKKDKISFQRIISAVCTRPAELLGASKGSLTEGFDADFIVVDLKNITRIKSSDLHSKCGWSPFEDWPALFPESVFVRGEKLIDENEIQVSQGFGKFIGA